jgi:hypothetical protein
MSPAVFEPALPSSDRPKTHALDRTATGIGGIQITIVYLLLLIYSKLKHLTTA